MAATTLVGAQHPPRPPSPIVGREREQARLREFLVATIAGQGGLVLVGGEAIREHVGWDEGLDQAWAIARWPLGLALVISSVALLFKLAPRRRQPDWSWLAFGAAVSALLWLAFMGVLKLYIEATDNFGATYGPIAGTIGVLLWAFAAAVALFVGLAFAAQLEAVRAGVPAPRTEHDSNA